MLKKFFIYITKRHRLPLVSLLCLIVIYASAQTVLFPQVDIVTATQVPQKPQQPQRTNQKPGTPNAKIIRIIKTKDLLRRLGDSILVLKDSVVLFHEGAYLYCDSAYFNETENFFEAFSNVRMEQGDTIFLYGNYMEYDGNIRLVKVRENVSLVHEPQGVTLFTDFLDYDRAQNVGYYFDGGMLVDSLNELTSIRGQYEPNITLATFNDSVVLLNPKFTLYSDQLKYNTDTRIAIIETPTTIVSDSGKIYTSKGWYNTTTEESLLLDQSTIVNNQGNRILRGDSISYHKAKGYGEVFGNMFLQDTAKHVILRGHYGYYNELTDYAMATDSAYAIEYSQPDSLYIHGDTLKLIAVIDTVQIIINKEQPKIPKIDSLATTSDEDFVDLGTIFDNAKQDSLAAGTNPVRPIRMDSIDIANPDSTGLPALPVIPTKPLTKDSIITQRIIKAYYGVRFYRSDIQGVCDSLQFSSKDSVLHMYKDPVLWNTGANITNRQIYGDTINVYMNDSTVDYMHVYPNSFVIEQKDSIHFNQLKSRSLKVYFEDKKTRRVFAEGNVETVTYPEERDGALSQILSWLEGSFLDIGFKEGRFDRMVAYPKPVTRTTPFHLVTPEDLRLKGFYWYDYLRPVDKDDIFRKVSRKETDVRPKRRSSIFDRVEE